MITNAEKNGEITPGKVKGKTFGTNQGVTHLLVQVVNIKSIYHRKIEWAWPNSLKNCGHLLSNC